MSEKHYTLQQLGYKAYFNQQLTLDDLEQSSPYRVTQVFRNRIILRGEDGELDLPLSHITTSQNCTVGDWLLVNQSDGRPSVILDRLSVFARKSPGTVNSQLIAANVDTAFIVSSCNDDFNLSRIERYLALAKDAQVEAVLVLTKADLISDGQRQNYLDQLHQLQAHLMVITINALDTNDCEQLNAWCGAGQTVVLLGSSGVGKTTITNTLCGTDEKTAAIRQDDSKGRHTTTARALFFTLTGGLILDCPGMRELQLTDCEEGVKAVFADVELMAQQCKFTDCQHHTEPGCVIQQAITNNLLDKRRLTNYQKMLKEQARNTMTLAESHQKDREFGQLIKSSLKAKREKYD
jgi:ribosome biogenesis GTPase